LLQSLSVHLIFIDFWNSLVIVIIKKKQDMVLASA